MHIPDKSAVRRWRERRNLLAQHMGDGVAVIPTAPERIRNRDTGYPYRFDSYFHYLTGFTEPEAVLVLVARKGRAHSLLLCRDKDPEREIWEGFRHGPEGAKKVFGLDETDSIANLDARLPKLLIGQPALFFRLGSDDALDARAVRWLNEVRREKGGPVIPDTLRDVYPLLDEMRLIKDEHELEILQHAADISADAHCRAMRATRPGGYEYQVEAEILHEFRSRGAQSPAYPCIVAAGANACTLHYVDNDAPLRSGELLLIDAGCELDGYAADITRTFPVNGRFSGPQRDLYQLVLDAQRAAIKAIRPGRAWNTYHDAAVKVLAQGFVDLGLLTGSLDEVLEKESYKQFYMHRTGHPLGMDVHDAGRLQFDGKWRKFAPGMVLTVEPGCYVRPAPGVPEAFWNIGIRIEDDVCVTEGGCTVLTEAAPVSVRDIEDLMKG